MSDEPLCSPHRPRLVPLGLAVWRMRRPVPRLRHNCNRHVCWLAGRLTAMRRLTRHFGPDDAVGLYCLAILALAIFGGLLQ